VPLRKVIPFSSVFRNELTYLNFGVFGFFSLLAAIFFLIKLFNSMFFENLSVSEESQCWSLILLGYFRERGKSSVGFFGEVRVSCKEGGIEEIGLSVSIEVAVCW